MPESPTGIFLASLAQSIRGDGGGQRHDGTITYTPTEVFFGADSFTYTVADNQGAVSIGRPSPSPSAAAADGPTAPTTPTEPTTPTAPHPDRPDHADRPTPVDLTGPLVRDVFRFGTGRNRTALLVTFSEDMNPALASNFANYVVVAEGRGGRQVIPIDSANYDPNTRSVKLFPSRRLELSRRFRLTIRASSPTGVADTRGRLLDGDERRQGGRRFHGPHPAIRPRLSPRRGVLAIRVRAGSPPSRDARTVHRTDSLEH